MRPNTIIGTTIKKLTVRRDRLAAELAGVEAQIDALNAAQGGTATGRIQTATPNQSAAPRVNDVPGLETKDEMPAFLNKEGTAA